MKRREFNLSVAAAAAMSMTPLSLARKARAVTIGSGATPVFNFTSFTDSPSNIHLANNATFNGPVIQLLPPGSSHVGANIFYITQQPPSSFTTQFTFQPQDLGSVVVESGFVFVVQNTQFPLSPGVGGLDFGGDANMCGYGGLINQFTPVDAIAIKFDAGNQSNGQNYRSGGLPSSTGLYFNQGPSAAAGSLGLLPCNDLNPYGINLYSGNTFQVTIVYDGSLITMTMLDTVTNAQARYVWPLNLANTTNANANYVGFSAGRSSTGYYNIKSWSYYTGYNTRLTTPTFSPIPGNYSTSQRVTISYPPGSTCYYTTNGLLPTSSSTEYSGPITVSVNEVVQAVAIQSSYTDSLVASGNYVIGTSSNAINFPTGFSAGNLIPVGYASLSGSAYQLTDSTNVESGAVWFPVPVSVSSFSTTFTMNFLSGGGQGMCFVLQNNPQPYSALSGVQIIGTSGQISFNPTKISVGQYVTIAGNFGGTGSINGYASTSTYVIGATNGTTTATLCAPAVASASQSGSTFSTVPQTLVAGTAVYLSVPYPGGLPGGTYYVLSSGLTGTTCQLALSPGGAPLVLTSSVSCYILFVDGAGGGGATLATTPGTPSGLTFSVNAPSWSGGPTAVGGSQSALGYGGINAGGPTGGQSFGLLNSVAVAFSQYAIGSDPPNGVGLYSNGANPYGSQIASGLSFVGSFKVTLTYDGTRLSLSMQPLSGGTTFRHSWTIDIPSNVGATSAYAGFTGGTGGAASVQAIQSWTYSGPVPLAPTNLTVK